MYYNFEMAIPEFHHGCLATLCRVEQRRDPHFLNTNEQTNKISTRRPRALMDRLIITVIIITLLFIHMVCKYLLINIYYIFSGAGYGSRNIDIQLCGE